VKEPASKLAQNFSGRLLLRQVNWLGDQVMTTPAIQRLRESFPKARIVLLTPEKLAGLWSPCPIVDEIVTIKPGEGVFAVARKLRGLKTDISLILPNSSRSALESWLAGIPRRVAYGNSGRSLFLTDTVPRFDSQLRMRKRTVKEIKMLVAGVQPIMPVAPGGAHHQIHDYLRLAGYLGADTTPVGPRLWVDTGTERQISEKFGVPITPAASGQKLFALNAGAEYGPAKRWPAERFAEAATAVQSQTQCTWVILGGGGDTAMAEKLATAISSKSPGLPPPLNLAGRTTLTELKAVLKQCKVLLGNDTGPAHVAAALGVPVVIPFGSTSPNLTGPGLPGASGGYFISGEVPCAPCFLRECPIDLRCMTQITVEMVTQAVIRAISD
jgi:lipopolysaccharide heptosyltransferase II